MRSSPRVSSKSKIILFSLYIGLERKSITSRRLWPPCRSCRFKQPFGQNHLFFCVFCCFDFALFFFFQCKWYLLLSNQRKKRSNQQKKHFNDKAKDKNIQAHIFLPKNTSFAIVFALKTAIFCPFIWRKSHIWRIQDTVPWW